jgi:hypothetical protein
MTVKRRRDHGRSKKGRGNVNRYVNRVRFVSTGKAIPFFVIVLLSFLLWTSVLTPPHPKSDFRVVVSLSTIPSRIHLLQPALDSIMNQHETPDVVYLTLPKKKKPNIPLNYTVPKFIQTYQRQGKLRILTPEWDYGSISKVFHVLLEEPIDSHIIYVDDDWIYHPTMIQVLHEKSLLYPDCAVAFSGGVFRNYFRQVGHTQLHKNRHPFLFWQSSGTPAFWGEAPIDISRGCFGALVKPRFFDLDALQNLLLDDDLPEGVVRSDDFIISSHLEWRNVTRMLVDGGISPQHNEKASEFDKLSRFMYNHAMEAALYLQHRLHIWQPYRFLNLSSLAEDYTDAIHCENGRGHCFDGWQQILEELDRMFPPA